MPRRGRGTVYRIERSFGVPLAFAFRWCTDYTPEDGKLAGDGHLRRILRKSPRITVFEDLYDYPEGWFWSRQTVTLHPPNRWTARADGNYRTWDLEYSLRRIDDTTTRFRFWGLRRAAGLGTRNPPQRAMKKELGDMWSNYARAMESDYRSRATWRRR